VVSPYFEARPSGPVLQYEICPTGPRNGGPTRIDAGLITCRCDSCIIVFTVFMDMVMRSNVITSDPQVMGGTPVFKGTRVPMQTLIDYLEAGNSIEEFLEGFPTVEKQQVIDFLEEAKERFLASA
jgi:uncharacterized protein (DUF433 family)